MFIDCSLGSILLVQRRAVLREWNRILFSNAYNESLALIAFYVANLDCTNGVFDFS